MPARSTDYGPRPTPRQCAGSKSDQITRAVVASQGPAAAFKNVRVEGADAGRLSGPATAAALVDSPGRCADCRLRYVSPSTGKVASVCGSCGGDVVSEATQG